MATRDTAVHPGGGFNPPEPTTKGGPDYGRFIAAIRDLQDHGRAADAPDEVITAAAELIERASALLAPHDTDEWTSPSGRRFDLPNRGNIHTIPNNVAKTGDGRVAGTVRFRRYHLGRNGAVHGGAIAMLYDSILGMTSSVLTGGPRQRTAYLHVNYRRIVPIEKDLWIDAGVRHAEGRKIFVEAQLRDPTQGSASDAVLTDAEALFVLLKPGQP